ncbi:MAG: hypothetical protein K0S40_806 [Actinomycetospora sp.]|nr:hypothetical protein [Actinomycetospora sp.]
MLAARSAGVITAATRSSSPITGPIVPPAAGSEAELAELRGQGLGRVVQLDARLARQAPDA